MVTVFNLALLISFGVFILPKKWKYPLCVTSSMAFWSRAPRSWAIQAFTTDGVSIPLGISTWSGPIHLVIDRLSAYFILIINFICLCGFFYAGGYLKPYMTRKHAVFISLTFSVFCGFMPPCCWSLLCETALLSSRLGIDVVVFLYPRNFEGQKENSENGHQLSSSDAPRICANHAWISDRRQSNRSP